jgi:hypothetical protein
MSKLGAFLSSSKPQSVGDFLGSSERAEPELKETPTESKQVATDVVLYTTKMEDSSTGQVVGIKYEGENKSSTPIKLTVDIEGSRNVAYVGSGSSTSRSAEIFSGSRVLIGQLKVRRPAEGYELKMATNTKTLGGGGGGVSKSQLSGMEQQAIVHRLQQSETERANVLSILAAERKAALDLETAQSKDMILVLKEQSEKQRQLNELKRLKEEAEGKHGVYHQALTAAEEEAKKHKQGSKDLRKQLHEKDAGHTNTKEKFSSLQQEYDSFKKRHDELQTKQQTESSDAQEKLRQVQEEFAELQRIEQESTESAEVRLAELQLLEQEKEATDEALDALHSDKASAERRLAGLQEDFELLRRNAAEEQSEAAGALGSAEANARALSAEREALMQQVSSAKEELTVITTRVTIGETEKAELKRQMEQEQSRLREEKLAAQKAAGALQVQCMVVQCMVVQCMIVQCVGTVYGSHSAWSYSAGRALTKHAHSTLLQDMLIVHCTLHTAHHTPYTMHHVPCTIHYVPNAWHPALY